MKKLQEIITSALENCYVRDGWPVYDSCSTHITSLYKEVLKVKSEWLDESDIYRIFLGQLVSKLYHKYQDHQELHGQIKQLLTPSDIADISHSTIDYIESIPRNYEVYLPLPSVVNIKFDSLEICKGVWVKSYKNSEDIPGGYETGLLGLLQPELDVDKVYLVIRSKGYTSGTTESSSTRNAITNFKMLLHSALTNHLFELDNSVLDTIDFVDTIAHKKIPKINLTSVDVDAEHEHTIKTEMPLNLSIFLHQIKLNEKVNGHDGMLQKLDEENLIEVFMKILEKAANLVNAKDPDFAYLKAAAEWSINSKSEQNLTLSFIQNCIGLESVLGDGLGDSSITLALADRCAYIIGTNTKNRKMLRSNFKKLYQLRSKIVHGKVSRLTLDQSNQHYWGQKLLDIIIKKEIDNLQL
ncbi:MAG: HEPN domain-containing protein [Candidatus Thiodiazotropha taylori]|nr:HEPN domain-containing protein [Candidatus Thiodiazotropha taylori]